MRTAKIILLVIPLLVFFFACEEDDTIKEVIKEEPEEVEEVQISGSTIGHRINPETVLISSKNEQPITRGTLQILLKCDRSSEIEDNGTIRKFRYKIDSVSIQQSESQKQIKIGSYNENINFNDTLSIVTDEELDYNKDYEIFIDIVFQELIEEKWEDLRRINGTRINKIASISFSTIQMPDEIVNLSTDDLLFFDKIHYDNEITPIVTFKFKPGKDFYFSKKGEEILTGRMVIDDIYLLEDGERKEVSIEQSYNVFKLSYTRPFSPKSTYSFVIKASYQEKVDEEWVPLSLDGETERFTIEEIIPLEEGAISSEELIGEYYVDASYPMPKQFNFYPKEYSRGFIKFLFPLNYFSELSGAEGFTIHFIKYPEKTHVFTSTGNYNPETGRIWYDLPENLENETPYGIEMYQNDKLVYRTSFRVSQHDYFAEKLPESLNVRYYYNLDVPTIDYLGSTHYFDNGEEGLAYNETMMITLRVSIMLDEWEWYNNSIFHYIYENHPIVPSLQYSRDISKAGMPPDESVELWQIYYGRKLTEQEMEKGWFYYEAEFYHVLNTITKIWDSDYNEAFHAVREAYSSAEDIDDPNLRFIYENPSSEIASMIDYSKLGDYNILFEYILPGTDIVTSQQVLQIVNDPLY